MAVAARVVPWSPPPTPPLPRNRVAAGLARSRLAVAAADAVMYLILAAMWVLQAGMATRVIGRRAFGEDSRVGAAASKVTCFALLALALLSPFALPLLLYGFRLAASSHTKPAKDAKAPAPNPKSFAAAARGLLRDADTVLVGILAVMVLGMLGLVGDLVTWGSTAKGSRRERIGSGISDAGCLGFVAMYLFVIIPIHALRIWRMKGPVQYDADAAAAV